MRKGMESLTVSLSQCEDTLKQQAKKTADLEAQRSAVDEKLVQHVSAGLCRTGCGATQSWSVPVATKWVPAWPALSCFKSCSSPRNTHTL